MMDNPTGLKDLSDRELNILFVLVDDSINRRTFSLHPENLATVYELNAKIRAERWAREVSA